LTRTSKTRGGALTTLRRFVHRKRRRTALTPPIMSFDLHPLRTCLGVIAAAALAVALPACGSDDDDNTPSAQAVTDWNAFAAEKASSQLPPFQVNTLAIVQLSVHDALNTIEPRYEPYAYAGSSATGASVPAAVAAATRDTLVQLLPDQRDAIEQRYAARLAALPDEASKNAGLAVGRAAAAAVLARRQGQDIGAALAKPYAVGPAAPGVYQLTPPANIVIGAGLGALEPFAPTSGSQFRSPAPYATGSSSYAVDYDEVRLLGSAASTQRSAEQTEIARFWYDVIAKEWHHAARQAVDATRASEWQAARTLAVLSVAMADGVIASFDTKFTSNTWRPITAVRAGDADGNAATAGDAQWEPLCVTPPFPEHNSTHAVTGAAAATVLAQAFGDNVAFTISSPTGAQRNYTRFGDAAVEEGASRIYCGIHFRRAMDTGLEQGTRVAEHAGASLLQPVR
jgi:hypothetical protein